MRGMKKWLPFKSLNGQYAVLKEHQKEREKIEKPELSEDEIESINSGLNRAKKGDEILVKYYEDGEILEKTLKFTRVDIVQNRVIFSNLKLPLDCIISFEIKN